MSWEKRILSTIEPSVVSNPNLLSGAIEHAANVEFSKGNELEHDILRFSIPYLKGIIENKDAVSLDKLLEISWNSYFKMHPDNYCELILKIADKFLSDNKRDIYNQCKSPAAADLVKQMMSKKVEDIRFAIERFRKYETPEAREKMDNLLIDYVSIFEHSFGEKISKDYLKTEDKMKKDVFYNILNAMKAAHHSVREKEKQNSLWTK